MESFEQSCGGQLSSLGVDRRLWRTVEERMNSGKSGTETVFKRASSGTGLVSVTNLAASAAVAVFAHDWVFGDRDTAHSHLAASEGLRRAASALVRQSDASAEKGDDLRPDRIMKQLYKVAFEFEVVAGPAQTPQKLYCVAFDPVAPPSAISFSSKPLLRAGIFIDTRTSKSYTLLWPAAPFQDLSDIVIEKGATITRGALTGMPDYSTNEYWIHHYATSNESTRFDWFMPWSKGLSATLKQILPPARVPASLVTVLDVGCGNSGTVGDGMVHDGLADVVLQFDVSREAVATLAGTQPGEKSSRGLQQYAVFNAALEGGMPFRRSAGDNSKTTDRKLFDWVFDKGTTDGMLRAGVQVVKQMWMNLARVTDVVVLVSLGSPQSRVLLIEDEISGGWTVDQCLEVDGLASGVKTAYIYVCKLEEKRE
ncbi:hypothetical protein BC830DRAFT_1233454 [Chytriomyces sp. MP71]|nr:hypothetical protein BC830DRAFT_1233454 [Chytriomyces sp. MP71]